MIIKVALKSIKLMFKNGVVLPLLIGLPLSQIFLIKEMMEVAIPSSQQMLHSSIMEVVYVNQGIGNTMSQSYAASLLVMFILITGIMASSFLIDEKEHKTMMRVFSTPIKKLEYILGNLLGHSVFMLCIALSIIFITKFAMEIDWGNSLLWILIVTMLVIFVAITMGYCFAALFSKPKLANGIMSFVVVVMTFLSGGLTFNGAFGGLNQFTINKWGFEAYLALMRGESFSAIRLNLIVLLALGIAFTLIAAFAFRRENAYE